MTVETEISEEVLFKEFPKEGEIVQSLRETLGDKFIDSKIVRKRRVYITVAEGAHREAARKLKAMGVWYTPSRPVRRPPGEPSRTRACPPCSAKPNHPHYNC